MENVKIVFKKTNEDAKLPTKNMEATGWDVYAVETKVVPARGSAVIDNGLQLGYITPGFWIQVATRSGLGFKKGIEAFRGVIDQDYRGNLGIKLYNNTDEDVVIEKGDRYAQLLVYRNYSSTVEFGEVENTERGTKGFGSSGK